jgi:hypothetical protein
MNFQSLLPDIQAVAVTAVVYVSHTVIGLALIQNAIYLLQLVLAFIELRQKKTGLS